VTSQYAHSWEEKNLLSLLEIKPQIVQPTALTLYQLNYAPNDTAVSEEHGDPSAALSGQRGPPQPEDGDTSLLNVSNYLLVNMT
jgi:hypothetical protein